MGKHGWKIGLAAAVMWVVAQPGAWAATQSATASVSASVPARAEVALARDTNSVGRGSAGGLVFDKYDDQDMTADPNASSGFMYAPYRSETGKNWHVAKIVANGSSLTLTVTATGTVGAAQVADRLKVWCGGFFLPGEVGVTGSAIAGTASTAWESLAGSGFSRNLSQAFNGTASFNYQLNVADISAGTYNGTLTFTLTSN